MKCETEVVAKLDIMQGFARASKEAYDVPCGVASDVCTGRT